MSFKSFSILRSFGHFVLNKSGMILAILEAKKHSYVQQSGTILGIYVDGHPRYISVNFSLKTGHWSRVRCHLKVIFFLALAAILFSGANIF